MNLARRRAASRGLGVVSGGARGHRDLIFDVDLSHPRRCELWQLLHQRLRRVRVSINDSSIPREAASRVGWLSHWSAHDERGGEFLQHRVDRDDPCGRPRQSQRIWLGEAKCSSSSYVVGVVSRRTLVDVLLRLSPTPPPASSAGRRPPMDPCAAPSAPPCGACWETRGSSRVECRGRLAPFAADVEVGLGRRQSLARCRKPRQLR